MYENPNDELYFGEVYRQILQEAWLPEKAEEWARVGKSMRGRRPTQMGMYARSPTEDQSNVRQGFSKCAAAWKTLPWDNPDLPGCDDRWGKEYWLKEKEDRGVPCSYYDLFMRYCLRYWLDNQCLMPSVYTLDCGPPLTGVVCKGEYTLPITGSCGSISLVGGEGSFSPPDTWTAPGCGIEGTLYFEDNNGASGCLNYAFDPAHYCNGLIWPDTNPQEVPPSGSVDICVEGGAPPYHWIVAGTGFSLASSATGGPTNTLIAGAQACGSAAVLVTDFCDFQVTGHVRSTAGQWVLKSTGTCVLGGAYTDTISVKQHARIEGNKKQTQYWDIVCSMVGGGLSCDNPWICNEVGYRCNDHPNCLSGIGCSACLTGPDVPELGCIDTSPGYYHIQCIRGLYYFEWHC